MLTRQQLPIARYRFTAQLQEELWLPEYAGSLFRGQFGAALRRLSCMTRLSDCHKCPLKQTCAYTQIFQPIPPEKHELQAFSAIPAGYIIVPPMPKGGYQQEYISRQFKPAGACIEFEMVLIGHVRKQLPLIIYAWQRALQRGLTRTRKKAKLLTVQCLNSMHNHQTGQTQDFDELWPEFVWTHDTDQVQEHEDNIKLPDLQSQNISQLKLSINTPLRLQSRGRVIGPQDLNQRILLSALARRVGLLLEFHTDDPDWGASAPTVIEFAEQLQAHNQLRWFDWRRYSSRQRQEMTLGGVVGSIRLQAEPEAIAAVWPWFWLGQWLHIGKNASFGMGHYRLYWH